MADGAFTLTITFPRSSPRLAAATSKLDGMALPLGTSIDGVLGADAELEGALGVVDGLGAAGMLGLLGALAIFGSPALLGVLGVEKEGLEIVETFGKIGMAL